MRAYLWIACPWPSVEINNPMSPLPTLPEELPGFPQMIGDTEAAGFGNKSVGDVRFVFGTPLPERPEIGRGWYATPAKIDDPTRIAEVLGFRQLTIIDSYEGHFGPLYFCEYSLAPRPRRRP